MFEDLYRQNDAQFYNTDTGSKQTLATGVQNSPIRYSIVRSNAPRFIDRPNSVPFGTYSLDRAHKKTMESHARDNRRFYSSVFQSNQPRFGRPWTSPTTDAIYDVEQMSNSHPATISHSLDTTSHNYSILRSNYVRFQGRTGGEGSDVIYEIDAGHKMSLYKHMLRSPITYKNLGAQPTEYAPGKYPPQRDTGKLGPGCYDYKRAQDVSVSPYLDNRPLSSLASGTQRFGRGGRSSGMGQGSTWSQEKDNKNWASKGFHMNKAAYLRPQYLPKSYLKQAKEEEAARGAK